MIIDMLDYYNFIKQLGIDIIYSGPLWASGVEGIGETLKSRLAFDELPMTAAKSVFSVFVEQMNNMLMYSAEEETFVHSGDTKTDAPKGVFILGTQGATYFVQSGNVIKNSSVELLEKRINYINTLDKAELRAYYKEQIKREDTNPESKGAGLGFIEIARRASSKIEYNIKPLEDGYSFFTMFVTI